MERIHVTLCVLPDLLGPKSAASDDLLTTCNDIEAAHALDLWIGDRDVVDADGE